MTCATCGRDGGHGFRGLSRCPFQHGSGHAVKQDTILGGFLAENAWREPRWFDSQKAYERALDADGMMLKPQKPRHSREMDPQTYENAVALVTRNSRPLESFTLTTRVIEGERLIVPMERA